MEEERTAELPAGVAAAAGAWSAALADRLRAALAPTFADDPTTEEE